MPSTAKPYGFADLRRGSRHERGYGALWDKTRARILRRDAGICQPCLADGHVHQGNEVDHIVPKAQGGTEDDGNLQTICKSRHAAKTAAEALAARGIEARRPGAACVASGLPTDPTHPWNSPGSAL
jgi:5-methylcytosine-specific restriction protein A